MKKKFLKLFALLLVTVMCIPAISGCYYLIEAIQEMNNKSEEYFELVGTPQVICTYDEEFDEYKVIVDGTLKNTADKAWKNGVEITFLVYDAEGNSLGSAYDYIEFIKENGTWRFCAQTTTRYEAVSAELYKAYAGS